MIVRTFIGLTKRRAFKRALDFWYRKFKDQISLHEFFDKCSWKKESVEYHIIYRGPAPKDK